ncbi:MAG: hypothetical protein DRN92_06825 [Thermoproteota archaeon]|nr:MAG: hypothetical protein DRN92_06825 [Candidatus Korarchaeota archaeon]
MHRFHPFILIEAFDFKLLMKKKSLSTAAIISTAIVMIVILIFRIYEFKVSYGPYLSGSIVVSPTPSFERGSTDLITRVPEDAKYLCVLINKSHSWEFRAIKYREATFLIPADIDLDFEWSWAYTGFEMCGEEIMYQFLILDGLLVKAFTGNYSPLFQDWLRSAEKGEGQSFLSELLEWEKEGIQTWEMINRTLKKMKDLFKEYEWWGYREGALEVLSSAPYPPPHPIETSNDLELEWKRAVIVSKTNKEELRDRFKILNELLRKLFTGNYSREFELRLRASNETGSLYLELLRWKEEGLTVHDMINNTVKALRELWVNITENSRRTGALELLYRASFDGTYVIIACSDFGSEVPNSSFNRMSFRFPSNS